jgi:hypothetical protein
MLKPTHLCRNFDLGVRKKDTTLIIGYASIKKVENAWLKLFTFFCLKMFSMIISCLGYVRAKNFFFRNDRKLIFFYIKTLKALFIT